jgi:hypothetical protein
MMMMMMMMMMFVVLNVEDPVIMRQIVMREQT